MEIKRDIYLRRLIERRHNGMAKVVTGLRRCGKSYLLFKIFYEWLLTNGVDEDHIIRVNLENFANVDLRDPQKLYDHVISKIIDNDTHYILLDEVQMVPLFEDVLNGFLTLGNTDVYVTGSNAKYLSKDIITEFRGRGDEVNVYPLSFKEYLTGFDGSLALALDQYMQYGGLPQILSLPSEEQKASFLNHLVVETYLKDIKERHNLRKDKEMDDLVDILASSVGSLINPAIIANTFNTQYKSKIDADTIKIYIEHLSDAFLIERCKRFDVKGRRYINSPYKYYFSDMGLRNARLGFSQIDPGHMMENIIYNELRIRGFNVDVGSVSIRKRNKDGEVVRSQVEVDFIAHIGSRRYYIQSAYEMRDEEKMAQEMASLANIDDDFKKIIVVADDISVKRNERGIVIMSIYDFLLLENALEL